MFSLVVVLIILGCVAFLYLKSTFIRSFVMIITAICASVVAFGYFELLANVLISRNKFVPWAQSLCFALLFVLAFVILQIIVAKLTRWPIDLGFLAERIGRVVCGILLGLVISGLVLTALAIAPLPNKIPYQRFDATNPDIEKPNKPLLNADGFATGWFSVLSSGSLSGKRSFAALHPDFLDQVFLNRHSIADGIKIVASTGAIKVPKEKASWPATEGLTDSDGKPISPKSGHNLIIVRVGITSEAVKSGGTFALSQLRLVCKQKRDAKNPLIGGGKNIYPIGYLKTVNQLQLKKLNDQIRIERSDLDGAVRWVDFAFYVPNNFIPVLVEFKQNSIAQVPPPVTAEQAPPAVFFIQQSNCAIVNAELQPISSAKIYGVELATGRRFLNGSTLKIEDPNHWQSIQTANSIKPAQFENEMTNHVRAELKIEKLTQVEAKETKKEKPEAEARPRSTRRRGFYRPPGRGRVQEAEKSKGIPGMLEPLDDYELLSLKCNNPSTGVAIRSEQLPVLVEASGLTHYPVGIVASGKVGERYVCEFDYCSLRAEDDVGCLVIAEDSSVEKPFPDTVWLTEQAQEIYEFYVLYLVKSGNNKIIISVQPADSQATAGFKKYEGFLIE